MITPARRLQPLSASVRCVCCVAATVLLLACDRSAAPAGAPSDAAATAVEPPADCSATGDCASRQAPDEGVGESSPADVVGCQRRCDGTRCDDGCGGRCACADGQVCDPEQRCVPVGQCDDTCDGVGASCGTVCGRACGECALREACVAGACVGATSCDHCALTLSLADTPAEELAHGRVSLAIDHWPVPDDPAPRIMDLRIAADADVELIGAVGGDALRLSRKELYVDPETGKPFRLREDGSYQIFVFRRDSAAPIAAGRIATLTFAVAAQADVEFRLLRRRQTFAPLTSDAALQATPYDRPLTVTR